MKPTDATDPLNTVAIEYIATLVSGYEPLVMTDGERVNVAQVLRDLSAKRDQLALQGEELRQLADNRLSADRKVLPPRLLRRIANVLDEEAEILINSYAVRHGDSHYLWPDESSKERRRHNEFVRHAARLREVAG